MRTLSKFIHHGMDSNGRTLNILTINNIYLLICKLHENWCYIGSKENVRRRWSKLISDWKRGNRTGRLATYGHPDDPDLMFLMIYP